MKKLIYSIFMLLLCNAAFCQKKTQALYAGDMMPGYQFPAMLQCPTPVLDMNSLRGKVVILDFWDSSCSSCIDLMPHLQELQNRFKDSIQVILVNGSRRDDINKIKTIISNIEKYRGSTISLPIALCDSNLLNYFPHKGRPYEVVIDRYGKIVATTSAEDITEYNIRAVINGREAAFTVRNDFWNTNLPAIFSVGKKELNSIVASSCFIKNPHFFYTGPKYNKKNEIIGFSRLYTLVSAYQDAYRREVFYDWPVIEYNTKEPLFYNLPGKQEPELLLYDLICPPERCNERYFDQSLKQDLDKAFNFSLKRELKDTDCLVIRVNKLIKRSYSKHAGYDGNIDHLISASKNKIPVFQNAIEIKTLVDWLSMALTCNADKPFKIAKVVDESMDKNLIDISFPAGFDLTDFDRLKAFLSSKGIDLAIEKRKVSVVVIADKKQGGPTVL